MPSDSIEAEIHREVASEVGSFDVNVDFEVEFQLDEGYVIKISKDGRVFCGTVSYEEIANGIHDMAAEVMVRRLHEELTAEMCNHTFTDYQNTSLQVCEKCGNTERAIDMLGF